MAEIDINNEPRCVQIVLITKQHKYSVPHYPFSISVSSTSRELNNVLNRLLKGQHIPSTTFEFLISHQLLRTSLAEHITNLNISTEEVISVEFFEKFIPPKPRDCLIHDNWVSAVAVFDKWILTGSYDNSVHIWTLKGKHQLVVTGHTQPVKAVAWLSVNYNSATFVSVSMDETAMIWEWNIESNTVQCIYICTGHNRSIHAVSINHNQTLMATGSWDSTAKIWSTSIEKDEAEDAKELKKAKMKYNKPKSAKETMVGHKGSVSSVVWSDKTEIITSSWDHTLKFWDVESTCVKSELYGDVSFFDLDYSPLTGTVITGLAGNFAALYDPRSVDGGIMKLKFTSHCQWVRAVRWSTVNEHLFISAAYDNLIKLWDTRSPKAPLFDLTGHEDKVFCCNWSNPKLIMSGSADHTLRIFKCTM